MLEFLGLQKEAHTVTVALILIFGAIGLALGRSLAEQKGKLTAFINGFSAVAGVAGLIKGFGPAIKLFFTFQWGVLLKGTFLGVLVGAALGFPVYYLSIAARKRKYRKNPVLQEAANYCRSHNIVGIQCFRDSLRFFNALENEEYCSSENKTVHELSARNGQITERQDLRPDSWKAYDAPKSYQATLKFSDRGYPELPDVQLFAEVLAGELKGFSYASHSTSVQYNYTRFNKDTGQTEHVDHTTQSYFDCFVYSKKALSDLKAQNASARKEREKAAGKPNTWE